MFWSWCYVHITALRATKRRIHDQQHKFLTTICTAMSLQGIINQGHGLTEFFGYQEEGLFSED